MKPGLLPKYEYEEGFMLHNVQADHLKIKQGQKVRVIPIAKDGFMIRKI